MRKLLIATCAAAAMLSVSFTATASTAAKGYNAAEPVPLDYWAVRSAVSNVSVSPDGTYMAVMKIESRDGDPVIEVYDTSDFSKPVSRSNAKPMEFLSIDGWVTDEVFFGTAMKVVGKHVKSPEDDIRKYRSFFYNVKTKKFTNVDGLFQLVTTLPDDPNNILAALVRVPNVGLSEPSGNFRNTSYYKLNYKKGTKQLHFKGGGKQPQAGFDNQGNPRIANGADVVSDEFLVYYRNPGDTSWKEVARLPAEEIDREAYDFVGDVPGTPPGIAYVLARNGADTTALWKYDFNQSTFLEKVYSRPDADIMGVIRGNTRSGDDEVKGVSWLGDGVEKHYFDPAEQATMQKVASAIPGATVNSVSLISRSKDDRTMIALNRSDSDSGTYYLIKDGKMLKIGSNNPLLKSEDYSKVEFVKIPARDGLMIPSYVTHPKGPGPHPLVVLPHGGPYVPEVIVYDEWSQMLANNGYMVVQPQYRGSLGRGYNHYIKMWNEHGGALQDDKDDTAKFLIKRGDVDADRVSMFGWSYGGYAALVAASREDQIYQCTIAGAFVADALKQHNNRSNTTIKYFDDLSAQRGGKVGINPINEVDKVNIPMLLIHPKHDRRVMFYHYQDYTAALKKAGKMDMVKTLVLDKADHFLYTHRYDHNKTYYSAILDYLQKDCGPGGL